MKDAFLKSIREEYPNEEVTRLVFADWCFENLPELEHKLRTHFPIIDRLNIHPNYGSGFGARFGDVFGDGFGSGYGYEYGSGYRSGTGSGFGFGYEYGYGSGYGSGYGHGYGHGDGFGSGSGFGYGYKYINPILNMPKLHTNQLIFLPNNFVICGYIQKHIQPYQFKIINASLIDSHNSTWEEVANNTNRNIISRKFGTITIGPHFFHSIDWIGDLP